MSRQDKVDVGDVDTSKIMKATEANGKIAEHVYNDNTDGKVVVIEYGDYQCPACKTAYPVLKSVYESDEFKDDVTFVFRNNPITQIHPNAKAASAAAEAAGFQGKYWEMHDALYEQQDSWKNATVDERLSFFVSLAKQVGVKDVDKFKSDMQLKRVSDKINYDLALGRKDGVSGTPTIFINGKQIGGDVWSNEEKFKKAVEDALK